MIQEKGMTGTGKDIKDFGSFKTMRKEHDASKKKGLKSPPSDSGAEVQLSSSQVSLKTERKYKTEILPRCSIKDSKTGLERYALTWVQIRDIITEEQDIERSEERKRNCPYCKYPELWVIERDSSQEKIGDGVVAMCPHCKSKFKGRIVRKVKP